MSTVEYLRTYTLEQYSVESWSEDGKAYMVTLGSLGAEDDLSTCSCPAFTFRPAARPCKHITEAEWQRRFTLEQQAPQEPGTDIRHLPGDVIDLMAEAYVSGLKAGARGFVR
jgi:hypothetical protein